MAKIEPTYELEYVPATPDTVTKDSIWFTTKCDSREQAIGLEKTFHDAGWVARIVVVKVERNLFG